MTEEKYYILSQSGVPAGPYTLRDLYEMKVADDTQVWSEGYSAWMRAGDLHLDRFIVAPPVAEVPVESPETVAAENPVTANPNIARSSKIMVTIAIVMCLLIGIMWISSIAINLFVSRMYSL